MADITTGQDVDIISALPTGDNTLGRVKLTDGTNVADVFDLTNSNPLAVALVDSAGTQITSLGGTAMTDDAAFTPASTSFTPTGGTYRSSRDSIDDNDGGAFAITQTRALYTSIETPLGQSAMDDTADAIKCLLVQSNGSAMTSTDILKVGLVGLSGGIALVDDTAFTVATDRVLPIGGTYRSARDDLDANDVGTIALTQKRAVLVALETSNGGNLADLSADAVRCMLRDGSGDSCMDDSNNALRVNMVANFDNPVLVDDAAFTPATSKIMMVGFEFDDTAPDSVNEGDGGAARMSANRNIYTTIRDAAGNERGVNVDATNRLSVSVDNSNVSTNIAQMNGVTVTMGNGASGTGVQRVTIASDSTGTVAVTQATASSLNAQVQGNVAHDTADSGNPVAVGGVAVSGSASPTSVASGDRTRHIYNQHGIPYVIGGHPNLITREYDFGSSAQTDVNLAAAAVAADERVYVTRIEITCDKANTVNVSARAGFGTANVPSASSSGVSGMIASHPGIAPGSGIVSGDGAGVIAVGGAGEEPRITTSAATSGNTHVIISYYLIDETP